jgi:hypothetical protein
MDAKKRGEGMQKKYRVLALMLVLALVLWLGASVIAEGIGT